MTPLTTSMIIVRLHWLQQ